MRAVRHGVGEERALANLAQDAPKGVQEEEELLQQARDLGRYPKESTHDVLEQQLANKLRKAKKANHLSHPALKTLQQAENHERPMKVDLV